MPAAPPPPPVAKAAMGLAPPPTAPLTTPQPPTRLARPHLREEACSAARVPVSTAAALAMRPGLAWHSWQQQTCQANLNATVSTNQPPDSQPLAPTISQIDRFSTGILAGMDVHCDACVTLP